MHFLLDITRNTRVVNTGRRDFYRQRDVVVVRSDVITNSEHSYDTPVLQLCRCRRVGFVRSSLKRWPILRRRVE